MQWPGEATREVNESGVRMVDVSVRDKSIFELVLFRLRDGATCDELLDSSGAVSEWVSKQPGFIDRRLLRTGDSGTYVEIVRWRSMEEASAAAALAESSPACAPLFSLIEPGSVQMYHGSSILETRAAPSAD